MTDDKKLTPKQAKFIDEYLIDLNATQAAIRAGYSKRTAKQIGLENLSKPYLQEKIQERRTELKEKAEIDQEWVLERYRRLAEVDPSDFLKDDGTLKAIKDIPKDVRYAIQGLDISESDVKKLKLSDKRATLDSIAKLLGLVIDKTERRFTDKDGEDLKWQVEVIEVKAKDD